MWLTIIKHWKKPETGRITIISYLYKALHLKKRYFISADIIRPLTSHYFPWKYSQCTTNLCTGDLSEASNKVWYSILCSSLWYQVLWNLLRDFIANVSPCAHSTNKASLYTVHWVWEILFYQQRKIRTINWLCSSLCLSDLLGFLFSWFIGKLISLYGRIPNYQCYEFFIIIITFTMWILTWFSQLLKIDCICAFPTNKNKKWQPVQRPWANISHCLGKETWQNREDIRKFF